MRAMVAQIRSLFGFAKLALAGAMARHKTGGVGQNKAARQLAGRSVAESWQP
jgi:hypothetical protein